MVAGMGEAGQPPVQPLGCARPRGAPPRDGLNGRWRPLPGPAAVARTPRGQIIRSDIHLLGSIRSPFHAGAKRAQAKARARERAAPA